MKKRDARLPCTQVLSSPPIVVNGALAAMKENKDVPKAPHYMKVTAMKHISTTCP